MIIAVIPARGGSKRVPRKNVKDFCGRPMIAWSVDAALESGCFDRVIVSTDDDEIGEVAVGCGADVPFRRPAELSDDFTPTVPVVAHAIRWQEQTAPVERACCIYATAPFIRPEDLRAGLSLLEEQAAEYADGVASGALFAAYILLTSPAALEAEVLARVDPNVHIEALAWSHKRNFIMAAEAKESGLTEKLQSCTATSSLQSSVLRTLMATTTSAAADEPRMQRGGR